MNTDNYRGITLISSIFKLFAAILNNRLIQYCRDKHILRNEQLVFVLGNRPLGTHVIIHNVIQDNCHEMRIYIYGCFVDFSKAFGSIPRGFLFQKLLACGINGKVYNLLKNRYSKEKCEIKIGKILTEAYI